MEQLQASLRQVAQKQQQIGVALGSLNGQIQEIMVGLQEAGQEDAITRAELTRRLTEMIRMRIWYTSQIGLWQDVSRNLNHLVFIYNSLVGVCGTLDTVHLASNVMQSMRDAITNAQVAATQGEATAVANGVDGLLSSYGSFQLNTKHTSLL